MIALLVWQVLILVPRPIAICVQHVVLTIFFKSRVGGQNWAINQAPPLRRPRVFVVAGSFRSRGLWVVNLE